MTESQRKKVAAAITQIHKMGKWDNIFVDMDGGEPVIYAAIHRHPVHKFLLDTGLFKKPHLPTHVEGIRCEVRVHYPAKRTTK